MKLTLYKSPLALIGLCIVSVTLSGNSLLLIRSNSLHKKRIGSSFDKSFFSNKERISLPDKSRINKQGISFFRIRSMSVTVSTFSGKYPLAVRV